VKFETQEDRLREIDVVIALESEWPVRLVRCPDLSNLDYMMYVGQKLDGWIEIKCRTSAIDDYPTLMLSSMKAQHIADAKPRGFLVVAWRDTIGWCGPEVVEKARLGTRIGGRPPRLGAVHDIESVIDIPIQEFTSLWETTPWSWRA